MEADIRQSLPEAPRLRTCESDHLSVREVAEILGVSERSVYGYIETGRLPGERIEKFLMVDADEVHAFERKAPGRVRTIVPRWRVPPKANQLFVTTITVRVHPGQQQALTDKLKNVRRKGTHCFPGTAARYIVCNQDDPDEIEFILVWRTAIQLFQEQWRNALAALSTDLADVLDWDTATIKGGQGLLHA